MFELEQIRLGLSGYDEKLEEMGYFNFDINYKFNEVVL